MALVVPRRSLSAMHGDADTKLTEFFECWGNDMSADLSERLGNICKAFMEKHAVARFDALFRLRRAQAEAIFVECGAGEGWLTTLEELSGFSFVSAPAPDSLSLKALSNGTKSKPKPNKYNPTLSDDVLIKGEFDSERIPEYVFDASTCACPEVDTLKESDIEAVTTRMLEYLAAKYGAWNIGKPLARRYGAQLAARFPNLPNYGKTDGRDREWWKLMLNKCKNRTHVCRCPHPTPPHLPTPGPFPLAGASCPQPHPLMFAEVVQGQARGQRRRPHRSWRLHDVQDRVQGRGQRGRDRAEIHTASSRNPPRAPSRGRVRCPHRQSRHPRSRHQPRRVLRGPEQHRSAGLR